MTIRCNRSIAVAPAWPKAGTRACVAAALAVAVAVAAGTLPGTASAQVAAAAASSSPSPPAAAPTSFDAALDAYDRGHHAAAFDALAALADAGDARAARIALLMQRHGPALYGRRFDVEPARRRAWLDRATAGPTASASR